MLSFLNWPKDPCDVCETRIQGNKSPANTQRKKLHEKSNPVEVLYGLPESLWHHLSNVVSFLFLQFQEIIVEDLLASVIEFDGGINLINQHDLFALSGRAETVVEKWLTNFIIDSYSNLISTTSINPKVKNISWEVF